MLSRPCLADHVLLRTLATVVERDRATTAEMLALIAEVDQRGLFRGEGYPSMYRYCVEKLRMSEDVACKRILTARAARRFPLILSAIMDGRLSISTVAIMSRHLKHPEAGEAEGLLTAALGKTRSDVEGLIAERFPRPDVPTSLVPVALLTGGPAMKPAENEVLTPAQKSAQVVANMEGLSAPGRIISEMGTTIAAPAPPPDRCEARKFLEYDHEQPLARGGRSCVANVRLRCRAHNQLEAERVFGAGFMEGKRSRNGGRHNRPLH